MDKIDFDTLLLLVKDYLLELGIDNDVIHENIANDRISSIYYKKLPPSDTFKENRINKKSNETHIAITGNSMKLFYEHNEISNIPETSKYYFCNFFLFTKNLEQLTNQNYYSSKQNEIITSISSVHISKRTKSSPQVSFGLKSNSTLEFINFRKSLYPNDLLIIMRTITPQKYFLIGISNKIICSLSNQLHKSRFVENKNLSNLKTSNQYTIDFSNKNIDTLDFEKNILNSKLKKTSIDKIAPYKAEEINYSLNVKSGISQRIKRYILHQKLVTEIAQLLENKGFTLFKGQIDCLAQKKKCITLILEIKTLSGKRQDEINQVRAAFAQLFYYNRFNITHFDNDKRLLIAVFDKKPNDDHIEFFQENNIEVIYKNKDNTFVYTSEIKKFIK